MNVDVLAIGPHPDDIEMTCSGLLMKMKKRGYTIGAIHMTSGEMGSRGTVDERRSEAAEAAGVMGLDRWEILGLKDGAISSDSKSVRLVAAALRDYRPRLVIAPYPFDAHPDHARAGRLAAEAAHCAELKKYDCPGEPHYINQLVYAMYRQSFRPSFLVDISAEFDDKLRAIRCYRSQVGETRPGEHETRLSSPAFLQQLEARHVYHGSLIKAAHAEAYFCEYAIALEDPLSAFPAPQQRRVGLEIITP